MKVFNAVRYINLRFTYLLKQFCRLNNAFHLTHFAVLFLLLPQNCSKKIY